MLLQAGATVDLQIKVEDWGSGFETSEHSVYVYLFGASCQKQYLTWD